MSILKIVEYGSPNLREKSKEVTKISKKIKNLITDMLDTMYNANGVGLAAPQVGENLRIFVLDVSDPSGPMEPQIFVNPKIIKKEGAIESYEGCLSFPQAYTNVRRYASVMVKALDINGRPFIKEAKDGCLLSRCIQHEFDHLEGRLFVDHCRNRFETDQILAQYNLLPVETDKLLDEEDLENQIVIWEKEHPEELEKRRQEIEELKKGS